MEIKKKTEELHVWDLFVSRIWAYVNSDDTTVIPLFGQPVHSLNGRIVGTKVRLRNGEEKWAVLTNVCLKNPRKTKQFLGVWIEKNGEWFELGRYFDVDYKYRGPDYLASFLGLPVDEIFPIIYDISDVAQGDPEVVKGAIPREPVEKLSEDELVALALEPDEP